MIRKLSVGIILCICISLVFSTRAIAQGEVEQAQTDQPPESEGIAKAEVVGDEGAPKNVAMQASRSALNISTAIILFPPDLQPDEFTEEGYETATVRIFCGQRVYGEGLVTTKAEWMAATSTGLAIELKRLVPIGQSESLTLQISYEDTPEPWEATDVRLSVLTKNDRVETTLFQRESPDLGLSDQSKNLWVWRFPKFPPPPKVPNGQRIKQLRIKLKKDSVIGLGTGIPEISLEVLWDNAIIQRYTVDEPWEWSVAMSEGITIDTLRPLFEEATDQIQLRVFASDGTQPLASDALSELVLSVVGIADDELPTVVCPESRGLRIKADLEKKLKQVKAEIKILNQLVDAFQEEPSQFEQEVSDAAIGAFEAKLITLNATRKQLQTQIDKLNDPDKRSLAPYWRFVPISNVDSQSTSTRKEG